jgi:N-acetylglucosaminyl-diphospho-decaprenol L-rhamnosyltransferase
VSEQPRGRVGAVVVNHNAGAALANCVASLRRAGVDAIVVVDNASSDRSLEDLAGADATVEIVPSARNLGYGRAANIGARRLDQEFILICNPDLEIAPLAVQRLLECMADDATIGICGPKILNADGTVYPSARAVPSLGLAIAHAFLAPIAPDNPFTRRYRRADLPSGLERDADWVSGACLFVRRLSFESLGGFDERYFMYVEDLDLCWRAGRAGWRVHYLPSAEVVHLGAVSTARHPYRMLAAHHYSTWLFALRSSEGTRRLMLPLIGVGLCARLVLMWAHYAAHAERRSARAHTGAITAE